ncbi:universal stress protein [Actinacidiphila sp. ITFR-21]|uniref:universal stress protein n=1 Tax=Actinacidiphila sp. ITFR-21 TaxID=3075199 RepID=UPI00288A70F4|nr:universal stress protein [Streptomyces sp. ITFR-21]WNI16477.1 universal stress protein [Streptomyces sp. ITFR-21]
MGFDRIPGDGGRVIVAGVDGSDSSWRAAAYAVGLARRQDALLVLVHVLPNHPAALMAGVAWMLAEGDLAVADELRRRVRAGLACSVDLRSLRWEFHALRDADAVAGITRTADEFRADAVVVGSSRGLWHRLFGSAGVRLVKCGKWPVTVVP